MNVVAKSKEEVTIPTGSYRAIWDGDKVVVQLPDWSESNEITVTTVATVRCRCTVIVKAKKLTIIN